MVDVQIGFHHGIDFQRIHTAGDGHAQRVAEEVKGVMLRHELRVFVEDLPFGRVIDFFFQFRGSGLAGQGEQLVEHLERFEITHLGEGAAGEHANQALPDLNQNRQGIGDDHCPYGCSKNDDEFGRLEKNQEFSVLHHVAGMWRSVPWLLSTESRQRFNGRRQADCTYLLQRGANGAF